MANKVDNVQRQAEVAQFYGLGFGEIFALSSINGSGTGELLDTIVERLDPSEEPKDELPRFAILGRPNVGKSTLTNALLGEERHIVSDIAGTTRDAVDTLYNKFGKKFWLIDTAGIRKKGKVTEDLEFYSVLRAIRALETADVCFVLIDPIEGLQSQDLNIISLAIKRRKGVVILVNKWDIAERTQLVADEYRKAILAKIAPFTDVPILFISALDRTRIHKALEVGLEVFENRARRISTSKLNEVMQVITEAYAPPAVKGKFVKIKYATQLPGHAPMFAMFTNHPQYVKENYRRYLENKLREHFEFTGVPISIFFRQK